MLSSLPSRPTTLQIVILSRDGQELGANLPGEVALRGPSVFAGYGGGTPAAEAANLEAFEGGWFHTGDEVRGGQGPRPGPGWAGKAFPQAAGLSSRLTQPTPPGLRGPGCATG